MVCWLCRHMSGAVYEEEHLGNFPHAVNCTGMPFPPPLRMAKHQVQCGHMSSPKCSFANRELSVHLGRVT